MAAPSSAEVLTPQVTKETPVAEFLQSACFTQGERELFKLCVGDTNYAEECSEAFANNAISRVGELSGADKTEIERCLIPVLGVHVSLANMLAGIIHKAAKGVVDDLALELQLGIGPLKESWAEKVFPKIRHDLENLSISEEDKNTVYKGTPLHTMVADTTKFTKQHFPSAATAATELVQEFLAGLPDEQESKVADDQTSKIATATERWQECQARYALRTAGLPSTRSKLLEEHVPQFQKQLKDLRGKQTATVSPGFLQVEDDVLNRWVLSNLDVWEKTVVRNGEDAERTVEFQLMASLRHLFTLLGLNLRSGEVFSRSAKSGNKDANRMYIDMLAMDKKDREVLAHETSERKHAGNGDEQLKHALGDRGKLAVQAISAMHIVSATKVPKHVLLTQLHRKDSTASTLVLSYMRMEMIAEVPVLYDVLEVELSEFRSADRTQKRKEQESRLLGAFLDIALDFVKLFFDEGVTSPSTHHVPPETPMKPTSQTDEKTSDKEQSDDVAQHLKFGQLAIHDPVDHNKDAGTTSTLRSEQQQLNAVNTCSVCLLEEWGGRQVPILVGPHVEQMVPGFDVQRPRYSSDFSDVCLGGVPNGCNAGFALKLHRKAHRDLFQREVHALRTLQGVKGIPVVEAIVHAGGLRGGLVTRLLRPYPFEQCARDKAAFVALADPLVAVLCAAHARGVAHCDLKDTAVMVRTRGSGAGELVLNDWNLSMPVDTKLHGRVVGTPQFSLCMWRPPTAAAVDCVALAVLLGWAAGLAELGECEANYADVLDRVTGQLQRWQKEPPAPEQFWRAKALLLVNLLLVCCEEPLGTTYGRWYYGCWLAADAPPCSAPDQSLPREQVAQAALVRLARTRSQQCHESLVVTYMDWMAERQAQQRLLLKAQRKQHQLTLQNPQKEKQQKRKDKHKNSSNSKQSIPPPHPGPSSKCSLSSRGPDSVPKVTQLARCSQRRDAGAENVDPQLPA